MLAHTLFSTWNYVQEFTTCLSSLLFPPFCLLSAHSMNKTYSNWIHQVNDIIDWQEESGLLWKCHKSKFSPLPFDCRLTDVGYREGMNPSCIQVHGQMFKCQMLFLIYYCNEIAVNFKRAREQLWIIESWLFFFISLICYSFFSPSRRSIVSDTGSVVDKWSGKGVS